MDDRRPIADDRTTTEKLRGFASAMVEVIAAGILAIAGAILIGNGILNIIQYLR